MKIKPSWKRIQKDPGVQFYFMACLVSLGIIALTYLVKGRPLEGMLLFSVGVLGILSGFKGMFLLLLPTFLLAEFLILLVGFQLFPFEPVHLALFIILFQFSLVLRVRSVPLMLLIAFTIGEFSYSIFMEGRLRGNSFFLRRSFSVVEFILSLGVLAFTVCAYRLKGLTTNLFPLETKEHPDEEGGEETTQGKRSGKQVIPVEQLMLVFLLPTWAIVAQVAWAVFHRRFYFFDFPPLLNRMLLVAWIILLGTLLVSLVLNLLRWRTQSPDEAAMFLQDVVWRETRAEQRNLNRWIAWKRVRNKKKEED